MYNINSYKEKLEQIVKDIEILDSQKDDEEYKLDKLSETKEELKNAIEELIKDIESTQNIGFESKNQIEKINSDISVSKEKISNNNINIDRFNKDIEELKVRIAELEEEKQNKISKKEVFETLGRFLNIDLSNFHNDLSRSLTDSTALEKHLKIFEDMENKMENIFNSK